MSCPYCYRASCDGDDCVDVYECERCAEPWHDPDGPHQSACPECDGASICPECDEDQLMSCDECGDTRCREHLRELSYAGGLSGLIYEYLCERCYRHTSGWEAA